MVKILCQMGQFSSLFHTVEISLKKSLKISTFFAFFLSKILFRA